MEQPQRVTVVGQPTNGLAIAGFVVSLVGLMSCGVFSPVAVVLSAIGMRREPKGLAIAGLVIGAVGCILLLLYGLGIVLALLGLGVAAGAASGVVAEAAQSLEAVANVQVIDVRIQQYQAEHGGALPDTLDDLSTSVPLTDPWGNPLRYEPLDDGGYDLRSAGPDGQFDTADDIRATGSNPTNPLRDLNIRIDDVQIDQELRSLLPKSLPAPE